MQSELEEKAHHDAVNVMQEAEEKIALLENDLSKCQIERDAAFTRIKQLEEHYEGN